MFFSSRAKTKSQKIQNSTPRLPLLMSNKAKTDSERHLCGHCQLRRLHQSHRSLHGGRHPKLPFRCRHLVHAGWCQDLIRHNLLTSCPCSKPPPTRASTLGSTTGTSQPRTTSPRLATAPLAHTTRSTQLMLPWGIATWMCQVRAGGKKDFLIE